ncbi:unnamed protein product [Phytophthora fragariaefolia]|uniref:Unnamed protein product n=1 Tax=Phytophthora fragariaefolia TaxID=1490495 RepID=A0A9W6Y3M5_9STRA|nr:unnamed protein product [Phytophthora fragariaefolia]
MADESAPPAGSESDADTIATRTRTKFSLVDVPIDTLEASLPDAALEPTAAETEEDREYQRFLSSLLPNEQENLSFLDEEDEEYRPDEDEDDHEDEDARRGISKKELTDLLLDSTHMAFPKLPAVAAVAAMSAVAVPPALEPRRDDMLTAESSDAAASFAPTDPEAAKVAATKPPVPMKPPPSVPAMLRGHRGAITQTQCIQLASQMHKHLQLLLQTYHLLARGPPSPELTECRAMIEELQQRGEKALKYKNTLLSKLNPGAAGSAGVFTASSEVEDADGENNRLTSATDSSGAEGNGGSAGSTENLLELRRVTRSLTAAHAAVAHPSMFELVGSQTVDELSAGFARGCSIEERNRVIQDQMLQLDMHLVSVKKRRKSKKGYTTTEDNLLAHGVKRFGTQLDAWDQIHQHFLPSKPPHNLRHRYKYLISSRSGMNAVKALHQKSAPPNRSTSWLLEEDLRIARGLVELHNEKYHFARLATDYLPYRSRLEIRKRWERLSAKFRSELAEIGLTAPDDDSLDLAVAMKEYLEDKLRNRLLRQRGEAERARMDAALQLQQFGQVVRGAFLSQPVSGYLPSGIGGIPRASVHGTSAQKKVSDATFCKTKNLHPALFFSSWSFISPAMLLNLTCKHNWPSFMDVFDDDKEKSKNKAVNTGVSDEESPQSELQFDDGNDQPMTLDAEQAQEFMPIEMPSELASTPTTDSGLIAFRQMPQAKILMDARMAQKESEEEEDDSDYEHDELLSTENEESDSEFEQMEFTDDEEGGIGDDEGSVDSFEESTFMSDSDAQSVESGNSLMTPSQSPQTSPSSLAPPLKETQSGTTRRSPRLQHPLRLQNLSQPGNERTRRALAALERRIVGNSINGSAPSSVASSQTGSSTRAKRKVASTLIAPLGASRTSMNAAFKVNENAAAFTTTNSEEIEDDDDKDDEDWEDGSGDEEFEVVELPSSSDEFATASSDEEGHEEVLPPQALLAGEPPRETSTTATSRREGPSVSSHHEHPNKKARLQECPTCGHSTCTCSSSERMQLLLRRMKEKRSSSSLQ